jgi:hypothetical protein
MRTPEEKARRKRHRIWGSKAKKGSDDDSDEVKDFWKPVRCYLRPPNIIGGGFRTTATGGIPEHVQRYVITQLAVA